MSEVYANTYLPPTWLNQVFLQDALRSGLRKNNLQIVEYTIRPATNVGDNFLSCMFRASLVIKNGNNAEENLSLIIKCSPQGDQLEKFVQALNIFNSETNMFEKTLPLFRDVLDSFRLPRLSAQMYYHQNEPNDIIILEDLCQGGFKPANRIIGLDLQQCVLVLETLATFHAVSLVVLEKDADFKKRHFKGFWDMSNGPLLKGFIHDGIGGVLKALPNLEGLPHDFRETLKKYSKVALQKFCTAASRRDDELNVLVHGDTWTNNFMFKYANEKPIAVKLVDFQLSWYSNPVIDLLYFIFSSPQDDIKIKNINFFLHTYHNKLVQMGDRLKCNIDLSFEELLRHFHKRLDFGFLSAIMIFPLTTAASKDSIDLENALIEIQQSGKTSKPVGEKFVNGLKDMLPYFIENGLFENL